MTFALVLAPPIGYFLRERELDDVHKLRFGLKTDSTAQSVRRQFVLVSTPVTSPGTFKISVCLPSAGDTTGQTCWNFSNEFSMLERVQFQPHHPVFCFKRIEKTKHLSEHVSFMSVLCWQ